MNATHPVRSLLSLKLGESRRHSRIPLTVIPLMWDYRPSFETVVAASAVTAGTMQVSELGGGTVPKLSVQNSGSAPVVIPQGTVLSGGRQDRVVNESVFVGVGEQRQIGVSCVQHGRWHGGTSFGVADATVNVSTRFAAGSTVFGARDAQQTVWSSVASLQTSLGVHSHTQQFTDVFAHRGDEVEAIVREFPFVCGAYGLAIAIGRKVVMIDVFSSARNCQEMWTRLIRGAATEALGARYLPGKPKISDVALKIRLMTDREWEESIVAGRPMNWRHSFGANQGNLLTYGKDVLHLSCVRQTAS